MAEQHDEIAAVKRLQEEWSAAYRAGDLERVVAVYAPDAVTVPTGRHARRGHAEIREYYAARMRDYDLESVVVREEYEVIGDFAFSLAVFRVRGTPKADAQPFELDARSLVLYKRIDGRWRVYRDMDTPSPEAAALRFPERAGRG